MGHPFSTLSYLWVGGMETRGVSRPMRPHHLHGCMHSFPSLLPCFRLAVAIRVQKHAGQVRITTRSIWWLGDLVGKARGMHGEAETLQFSAF